MIIERYLLREAAYTLFGVSFLLLVIFLSSTFVRLLSEAAEGAYPADLIFTIFGLKAVTGLMQVLPVSFFFAVLLALGRLYKDSEMVVLAACGMSPLVVVKSMLKLSVAVGLVVGALSFFLAPWSEEKVQQLLDRAEAKAEIEGIVAGRFNTSETGSHLIYVEEISQDRRTLTNIFAHTRDSAGVPTILTAASAYQETIDGVRYLVLQNGYRYDGTPGTGNYRIVKFERHGLRIQEKSIVPSGRRRDALPTTLLFDEPDAPHVTELEWRASLPLSAVVLALLAIPLAKTSPRQGRYGKVFGGIMLYIIYTNLLTVSRTWSSNGEVPLWVGMWWVHLVMLAVALIMLWRQNHLGGPKRRRG